MEKMAKQVESVTKNLIIETGENELPLSVQAVVSNDDLQLEILQQSSLKSFHQLKSVSRHWLSLIISSAHSMRWSKILAFKPPSALFLMGSKMFLFLRYDSVSLDIQVPVRKSLLCKTFGHEASNYIFMHSCNGLLLCCDRFDNPYVFNPTMNLLRMLPRRHILNKDRVPCWRLAFDPTKSPHYKVLCVEDVYDAGLGFSVQIQTYSSETCNWSVCGDLFFHESFTNFKDGIYWNGAIHWLNYLNKQPFYYKLDIVNHPVLTTIESPRTFNGQVHCDYKLFESGGCLLIVCRDTIYSQRLFVYEMRSHGHCEWSEKYIVKFGERNRYLSLNWRISSSVWCIVLGEREDASFMIIELDKKLFQYKFTQKTLRRICDLTNFEPTIGVHQINTSFASV